MSITLTTKVKSRSSAVITVTLKDENNLSITPNTLYWSLTDDLDNVINSRSAVDITSSVVSGTTNIAVYGDDIDISDGHKRIVLVSGTYDSTYGSNLPIADAAVIYIECN